MNFFFSDFLSKLWGFKAVALSSKDLKHYPFVTSEMICESSYSRYLVGISLHLRKWNVCIVCDKTASGNRPWSVCKPREPSKYPHLALKHQTHCWISLESIRWEPSYWKNSRAQSGLPMLKKHNNKMNVRRAYPVFGEVDPQRVVQLIEQFHKFLPLWGQEDYVSVQIIARAAASKLTTQEHSRAHVDSLLLPGKERAARVYCWTWLTVNTVWRLTTLAYEKFSTNDRASQCWRAVLSRQMERKTGKSRFLFLSLSRFTVI